MQLGIPEATPEQELKVKEIWHEQEDGSFWPWCQEFKCWGQPASKDGQWCENCLKIARGRAARQSHQAQQEAAALKAAQAAMAAAAGDGKGGMVAPP